MIYINENNVEMLVIPYPDKEIAFVVAYNKNRGKERIYVIPYKEYKYLRASYNRNSVLKNLIKSKVYRGKRDLQEVLSWAPSFGDIFLYEIDKKDPLFIEFISRVIPNYNPKEDIIKQIVVNKLTK